MSFYQGPPVSTMMNAFDEDHAALFSLHFRVQNFSLYGPPQFASDPVEIQEMLSNTTVHSLTAKFAQLNSSQFMPLTGNIDWSFISANSRSNTDYESPSSAFRLTVSYRLSVEKMFPYRQYEQFLLHLSDLSFSYFVQTGASDFWDWARGAKFLSTVIPWTPLKELGVSCGPGLAFTDCSKLLSSARKMSVCAEHSFSEMSSVGVCLSGCMCEGYVYDFKVTASFQQPFVEDFEMITSGSLLTSSIPKPLNMTMSLRNDYNRTCMDISWQRPPSLGESRLTYVYQLCDP
jgi:hypothetical protein